MGQGSVGAPMEFSAGVQRGEGFFRVTLERRLVPRTEVKRFHDTRSVEGGHRLQGELTAHDCRPA